ncbi:MAG TPA: hypothetical protein PKK80_03820 [Bacilli bacterium]|nr:hypothetical protein [Bacilli bacterium]
MKKSEIVSNYIDLSNKMEGLLSDMKVNFRKEMKDIIGITQNDMDRFSIEYTDNKTKLNLNYKVTIPIIYQAVMGENNESDGVMLTSDLVSETYSDIRVNINDYLEVISLVQMSVNNELKGLYSERDILTNKSKKTLWKLFHPKADVAISNINTAINEVEKINKELNNEKNKFENSNIMKDVLNSFVEATKTTYGLDMKMIGGLATAKTNL